MSDLAVSIILGLVLVAVIIALVIRNSSVKSFNEKRRAKVFADYVAETIKKKPTLNNKHGFFISPDLAELAMDQLKLLLPQAAIGRKSASIVIKLPNTNWIIPICTTEEYTERFI